MNDFQFYLQLGLTHVLDVNAYDHVLFLIMLSVGYTFASWRKLLVLVTLFTVGHTISLVLAAYGIVSPNSTLIECLIPVTILIGALGNLLVLKKSYNHKIWVVLFAITLGFGLIHGFGFASFYTMMNDEGGILPLVSFALGVELSQIIVALGVLVIAYIVQHIFKVSQQVWILIVSLLVIARLIPMLYHSCLVV